MVVLPKLEVLSNQTTPWTPPDKELANTWVAHVLPFVDCQNVPEFATAKAAESVENIPFTAVGPDTVVQVSAFDELKVDDADEKA